MDTTHRAQRVQCLARPIENKTTKVRDYDKYPVVYDRNSHCKLASPCWLFPLVAFRTSPVQRATRLTEVESRVRRRREGRHAWPRRSLEARPRPVVPSGKAEAARGPPVAAVERRRGWREAWAGAGWWQPAGSPRSTKMRRTDGAVLLGWQWWSGER